MRSYVVRSYVVDVLPLMVSDGENQSFIFEEFKEQLERIPEGFYETGLMWKRAETEPPTTEWEA